MNYYRRYIGDFQRDTGHLSLAEVGAYDRLLDHYYATGRALPVELELLYRIARAVSNEEKAAVKSVAEQFFPVQNGLRHNPRADRELKIAEPAMSAARTNGVKGGRPKQNPLGLPDEPTGGHPPTTNHQPPSTTPQPPTPNRGKADARATRLPADWVLPEPWNAWTARNLGWDETRIANVADDFRDYWVARPGKDATKLDWLATWRRWCRNQRGNGSTGNQQSIESRNAANLADWQPPEVRNAGR